ncbi:hypothetical protein KP509_34G071000 [Ceratopteris richardii]|uniref:UDP-N-acetylmuramate dehydrogenase n=1 Tax=Ceratopteris richardii TaxID=49495 RepID=A0A8T2QMH4_CERRI|nr:hypothetical protein KP509_34G071000 [Ceratopteris richardii]
MLSWSWRCTVGGVPSWLETSSATVQQLEGLDAHLPVISRGKTLGEVSTWGIGGPAKLFCEVHCELQLASVLRYCRKRSIPFLVVGRGSNCLFDDRGFDGCVILNRLCSFERLAPGVYHAGSGYPFNALGIQSTNDGFSGLEFASGIPGTVGGAVFMNASADGQETANVLKSVEVVTVNGQKYELPRDKLTYGYRSSPFQTIQGLAAICSATFVLTGCATAKENLRKYLKRRKETQPIGERSAGCVFRNPGFGCQSAGFLIDKAGLKGLSIGGAKVSELHANFIINDGNSRASDVIKLLSIVKERVKSKYGITLEEEIIYVPFKQ